MTAGPVLRAHLRLQPGEEAPDPFAVASDVQTATGWLLGGIDEPEVTDHPNQRRAVFTFTAWGHRAAARPVIRDARIVQLDLIVGRAIWVAYPGDGHRRHDLPSLDEILLTR